MFPETIIGGSLFIIYDFYLCYNMYYNSKKKIIKDKKYYKKSMDNKILEYTYMQFIYEYNIQEDKELKWNLATCKELNNEKWLEKLKNSRPYFFYKAMIGDIESLINIIGMYEDTNIFSLYDSSNNNVIDILVQNTKNDELVSFVKLLKEKYKIKRIFLYTYDIHMLIRKYIYNGNKEISEFFRLLIEEDQSNINRILNIMDNDDFISVFNISDDELLKIYILFKEYNYEAHVKDIKAYKYKNILKKYGKTKCLKYIYNDD